MLFLLALLILGIVWVASALIDNDAASMESLYGTFFEYSAFVYSCIYCIFIKSADNTGKAVSEGFLIIIISGHVR